MFQDIVNNPLPGSGMFRDIVNGEQIRSLDQSGDDSGALLPRRLPDVTAYRNHSSTSFITAGSPRATLPFRNDPANHGQHRIGLPNRSAPGHSPCATTSPMPGWMPAPTPSRNTWRARESPSAGPRSGASSSPPARSPHNPRNDPAPHGRDSPRTAPTSYGNQTSPMANPEETPQRSTNRRRRRSATGP